ncbi:MAG: hypothetical protein HC857_00160 [Synechococcales cyanobacterium RU_4_20]|nr:hypothetical protein [Synechococcales cyanobacterium RU_4_20]
MRELKRQAGAPVNPSSRPSPRTSSRPSARPRPSSSPFPQTIRLKQATQTYTCQSVLRQHHGEITAIALLRKNNFVTASQDGTLRLWHFQRNQLQAQEFATLQGYSGAIRGLALSSDSQHLASHSADGSVQLWHWPTASLLRSFATGPITSLIFWWRSPDAHLLRSPRTGSAVAWQHRSWQDRRLGNGGRRPFWG